MNRIMLQLFAKRSITSLKNLAYCTNALHRLLKAEVWNAIQACHQCTSNNISELIPTSLSDEFDNNEESRYAVVDVDTLTGGDEEKLKILKYLQLEAEMLNIQGTRIPTSLKTEHWKSLMDMQSKPNRIKYLHHLWIIEQKKLNRKMKQKLNNESFIQHLAERPNREQFIYTNSPVMYNLTYTSLFYRIRDNLIGQFYHYKLLQAEWFGPHIIMDCSYDAYMTQKNLNNCTRQLLLTWSVNRENFNPFDIHFCNVDMEGKMWRKFCNVLHKNLPDLVNPLHFTEQHYLDIYPKERLVYLTPHCLETLDRYDPQDYYIIGAFVDASRSEPLSLAKAKKEGLRMAKLPLDKYLKWAVGTKSLTLNQVLLIMNDLKDGLPWPEALKHVPSRKLGGSRLIDPDNEIRMNHLSAKIIRENYRKNLVYDLLMNKEFKSPTDQT